MLRLQKAKRRNSMKNKYIFVIVMLVSILIVSVGFTNIYVSHDQPEEDGDFVVVTSFYPMYIATMNVIGDTEGVTLKNLSEPQTGCLHDFQLTPADMKLLSTADVFIINGGGIESFMEEIAAQYPDLIIIEACDRIELLCEENAHGDDSHEHGTDNVHVGESDEHEGHDHDVNAHAWMSVANYRKQVANIANGLREAASNYAASFLANAGNYDRKLEELQVEQDALLTLTQKTEAILLHCAYDYVAKDLGLEVAFCMDLDEERQVSAGEVAEVLEVIKNHSVKYIFAEALYGTGMCELVQKEADVEVIYLNPLNRGDYDADSYLKGMRENLKLIREMMN